MDPESKFRPQRPPNPSADACLLSRLLFWWTGSLFRLGLQRPLVEADIFECPVDGRSVHLTTEFAKLWATEHRRPAPQRPRLLRVLFKIYAKKFLLLGVLFNTMEISIRMVQPQCLGGLIVYFSPAVDHGLTANDARLYAATIVCGSVLIAVFIHAIMTNCTQIGVRIRTTCTAMIYKKMMCLTNSMTVDGLNGHVINLMANDVARFEWVVGFMDCLWKGPILLAVSSYFIYQEIGYFGFIGIGLLVGSLPVQLWMGKRIGYYRTQMAVQTGTRVRYMNEILQAMQVIKMFTWEKPFASVIDKIRKKELLLARCSYFIRGVMLLSNTCSNISIFLSLIAYVYCGNALTARRAFVVTSYMQIIFYWSMYIWSYSIQLSAEALVSIGRIEAFLLLPESKADALLLEQRPTKGSAAAFEAVGLMATGVRRSSVMQETISKWDAGIASLKPRIIRLETNQLPRLSLQDATAAWMRENKSGSDVGILNVNLDVAAGKLCTVVGSVGSGKSTLLQVILGELDLDGGRALVAGVVSYAAQEPWLFVGSVRQNIVFIEAWDEQRYNEVIKVCALERDFELLAYGDSTIIGERGSGLSGGQRARVNLARAVYRRADIYLLDDPLSAVDSRVGRHIFEKCVNGFLKDKICLLVTHQLQYLQAVEHVVLMQAGCIEAQGSFNALRTSNNKALLNNLSNQHSPHKEDHEEIQTTLNPTSNVTQSKDQQPDTLKEESAMGLGVFNILKKYFQSVNSVCFVGFVVTLVIIAQVSYSFVSLHIAQWTRWEESVRLAREIENTTMSTDFDHKVDEQRFQHVVIYVIFMTVGSISMVTRNFTFFQMCIMASRNLHDNMFRGITRAWMSFFNSNPSGRILNRFSSDIDNVDKVLPVSLFNGILNAIEVLSAIIVVSMWNAWMLLPTIVLLAILVLLNYVFKKTSRPIRCIEASSRSPIFAHTNATLQGLSTIRAFNAEQPLFEEFTTHLDLSTSASYQFIIISRAFAVWVEMTCNLYLASALCFFLAIGNENSGSPLGLAITQLMYMTAICQGALRHQSELENQIINVQRVIEYAELESEPPLETTDPCQNVTSDWPAQGAVNFEKFSMRYTASGPKVLDEINIEIKPKEKIGIVGRTGAGKSSIIQALFRLAQNEGSIWIDSVDINRIGLHDLRSRISIIPQEPILFSGTMRYNVDPFEESDDEAIWRALALVELRDLVTEMPGGLDGKISDGGSNFSLGQRQLVCLARAVLRRNRILVIDEATANVDAETDRLIQTSIREQFADCTVLTIAHRLHTVMDSDRVLVMEAGRAVEFGAPNALLNDPKGVFTELVRQTGRESEANLRSSAEKEAVNRPVTS